MESSFVPNYDKIDHIAFTLKKKVENKRLDQYLSFSFPEYTRSFISKLIKDGHVTVNGKIVKPSAKIRSENEICIHLPQLEPLQLKPEPIPLDIIYEDEWLAAINKQPDLVVHPAKGNNTGTLVNGLLFHFNSLSEVNGNTRPGIVHRLDRFTSGVMLVAKNNNAHAFLAQQFESRQIQKEYIALVEGNLACKEGNIALPIAMDQRNRERMCVDHGGKSAETNYKTICNYPDFTLLHVFPKTGRTHQIRVHLKALDHPIVGDDMYNAKPTLSGSDLIDMLTEDKEKYKETFIKNIFYDILINRQALHAWKIKFIHPHTKKEMVLSAPLPLDFQRTLKALNIIWPSNKLRYFGLISEE